MHIWVYWHTQLSIISFLGLVTQMHDSVMQHTTCYVLVRSQSFENLHKSIEIDWYACEKLGNARVTLLRHMLAQAGAFSLRFTYCLFVGTIFQPYPDGRIDFALKKRDVKSSLLCQMAAS